MDCFGVFRTLPKETFVSSTVFDKGKTQVPAEVRQFLNVKDGDSLLWVRKPDGYLVRGTAEPKLLIRETFGRGGINCGKCGTNYEASLERCPKCGTPKPATP